MRSRPNPQAPSEKVPIQNRPLWASCSLRDVDNQDDRRRASSQSTPQDGLDCTRSPSGTLKRKSVTLDRPSLGEGVFTFDEPLSDRVVALRQSRRQRVAEISSRGSPPAKRPTRVASPVLQFEGEASATASQAARQGGGDKDLAALPGPEGGVNERSGVSQDPASLQDGGWQVDRIVKEADSASAFVLSGVLNHAELVTEVSKELTRIADVLPRVQLDGMLYDIQYKAVKWYTIGPARRFISSVFKPYSLTYKDTVDQINICAESVNTIATSAARPETRGLTNELGSQAEKLRETDVKLRSMQQQLLELQASSQRAEAYAVQILQPASNHYDLTHTIKLDVSDSKAWIYDMQFSQILNVLASNMMLLWSRDADGKRRNLLGFSSAVVLHPTTFQLV